MACVSEAIGLALPYSAGTPAPYEERDKYAFESGQTVMNLLEKNIKPRERQSKKDCLIELLKNKQIKYDEGLWDEAV